MRRVAVFAAAGLLLAACTSSSGKPQQSSPRPTAPNGAVATSAYLSVMRDTFPGVDDATLLAVAHGFCHDFDNGITWVAEVKASMDQGFTAYQAGQQIGAAVTSFCPQHSDVLPH